MPLTAWRSLRRSSASSSHVAHAARRLPPLIWLRASFILRWTLAWWVACSTHEFIAATRPELRMEADALRILRSASERSVACSTQAFIAARRPLLRMEEVTMRILRSASERLLASSCQPLKAWRSGLFWIEDSARLRMARLSLLCSSVSSHTFIARRFPRCTMALNALRM